MKSHWVMVVMDHHTRRIIGFAVQPMVLDGSAICRVFSEKMKGREGPKRLSSENDPLFQFHQREADLLILEIETVKSVPYIPLPHPFVERLIGTIRMEFLDHAFYWNKIDLLRKLNQFKNYYNATRVYQGIEGNTPRLVADSLEPKVVDLSCYR